MSGWIRNTKTTDGAPDSVLGKRIEARLRNGKTLNMHANDEGGSGNLWNTSDDTGQDIIAYRFVEDQKMTAEELQDKEIGIPAPIDEIVHLNEDFYSDIHPKQLVVDYVSECAKHAIDAGEYDDVMEYMNILRAIK